MTALPAALFSNPVWHALHGPHRHLALDGGEAWRYPADVAPFAALARPDASAFEALHHLLAACDPVWMADAPPPQVRGLVLEASLECLQMVLPFDTALPPVTIAIEALSCDHATEMVALTDAAFPGFFRRNTCRMGSYFGVRRAGALAAMAGERLKLEGYPEMSAICTHPDHRSQGLARNLIAHLARHHRRAGLVSWLHVSASNTGAIELYRDLGFETARTIVLHRIARADET
ncbi:MAG TPA: GNAT family N-acetyltransferase [Steroidobacteraceae bacterium]|nr:GNAT family N-acetyltransferase [Steroidobacteraceae bacterium]